MLDKMQQYQIENVSHINGGTDDEHLPECFGEQPD